MMEEINWERIRQEVFTRVRVNFPVKALIALNDETGNYTPVSGDSIAEHIRMEKWLAAHRP